MHANLSDGLYTPTEGVQMYNNAGYDVIAITDHDKIDGVDEARTYDEQLGMIVITGEEISCRFSDTQPKHIIGLFLNSAIINSTWYETDLVEPIFDAIHQQNGI